MTSQKRLSDKKLYKPRIQGHVSNHSGLLGIFLHSSPSCILCSSAERGGYGILWQGPALHQLWKEFCGTPESTENTGKNLGSHHIEENSHTVPHFSLIIPGENKINFILKPVSIFFTILGCISLLPLHNSALILTPIKT